MLTGVSYDTNSSELLERLNWKNLETDLDLIKWFYNKVGIQHS